MVVGAFPIVKLGALAVRQISKPLANRLKQKAKESRFFRTYVCMPPAQLYHWLEVNVKMRLLNLGKPSDVPKLNESMAIELGAELLGETIIFGFAALTLTAEYIRQSHKEKYKEAQQENRLQNIETKLNSLQYTIFLQNSKIDQLTETCNNQKLSVNNLINRLKQKTTELKKENTSKNDNSYANNESKNLGLFYYAVNEVKSYFGLKNVKTSVPILKTEQEHICPVCSRYEIKKIIPHQKLQIEKKIEDTVIDSSLQVLDDAIQIIKGKQDIKNKFKDVSKQSTETVKIKNVPLKPMEYSSLIHDAISDSLNCIFGQKKHTNELAKFSFIPDYMDETKMNLIDEWNPIQNAIEDAVDIIFGEGHFIVL